MTAIPNKTMLAWKRRSKQQKIRFIGIQGGLAQEGMVDRGNTSGRVRRMDLEDLDDVFLSEEFARNVQRARRADVPIFADVKAVDADKALLPAGHVKEGVNARLGAECTPPEAGRTGSIWEVFSS